MSKVLHNTDVRGSMLERLPHFLRGDLTVALLYAIADLMQGWEDLWADLRGLSLQDSTDYALDIVGSWVEVTRDGDEESVFRARILAQTVINASGGQREDVLQLLRIIRGERIKFWALGGGFGQINYQMTAAPVVNADQAAQIVNFMVEPGALLVSSYTGTPFGFAGNPNAYGFGAGQLGTAGNPLNGGLDI